MVFFLFDFIFFLVFHTDIESNDTYKYKGDKFAIMLSWSADTLACVCIWLLSSSKAFVSRPSAILKVLYIEIHNRLVKYWKYSYLLRQYMTTKFHSFFSLSWTCIMRDICAVTENGKTSEFKFRRLKYNAWIEATWCTWKLNWTPSGTKILCLDRSQVHHMHQDPKQPTPYMFVQPSELDL